MLRYRVRRAVAAALPAGAKERLLGLLYRAMGRERFQTLFHPWSAEEHDRGVLAALEARSFLPAAAFVQLSERCNFRCRMCSNSSWRSHGGLMEPGLFTHVVAQLKSHGVGSATIASAQGEPFLHPRVLDFLEEGVAAGLKVSVSTNGSLLTEAVVDRLVRAGLERVQFSFSGWDRESYESVYRGGSFAVAVRNLRNLKARLRECGSRTTLEVNGVVMHDAARQVRETVRLLRSIGIARSEMRFVLPTNWAGQKQVGVRAAGSGVSSHRPLDRLPLVVCTMLTDFVGIYCDGRVTACGCYDHGGALEIGDLTRSSLREVRNGARFRELVDKFAKKEIGGIPLCARCDRPYGRQGRMNVDLRWFGPEYYPD